ncbi:MAG: RNA polymerase sigma factor [Gemmataceae bacterium]
MSSPNVIPLKSVDQSITATDEDIILRLQHGDDAAFEQLVRRYEVELYGYLKRYLGDPALAEDVFQNTFFQVYQKRDMFDGKRKFRPWLYAVATHQAIDALRRQRRFTRLSLEANGPGASDCEATTLGDMLESSEAGPDAALGLVELRQRVRDAVDELPEHLKAVVIMAYFQELKHREISEVLDIPVGTVKSRLFTAVRLLQDRWTADVLVESKDP